MIAELLASSPIALLIAELFEQKFHSFIDLPNYLARSPITLFICQTFRPEIP